MPGIFCCSVTNDAIRPVLMQVVEGAQTVGLRLLIAEPHHIYRSGIHAIFAKDSFIILIEEAATTGELEQKLTMIPVDVVIINQSLLTDISILTDRHVVIIANKPDRDVLLAASGHGLRGYFLEEPDKDLLQKAVHLPDGCCLLDPALTIWALQQGIQEAECTQDTRLTTREREVLALRKQGRTIRQIAQECSISPKTVKTHLQNASRKLRRE